MASFRNILIGASLLLCVLLWRPIVSLSVGTFVRLYLHTQKGWHLSYGSLQWTQRGIEWSEIAVSDKNGFSLTAPRAVVSLKTKYVEVDQPLLILSQLPNIEDDGWKVVLREGTLRGKGLQEASFSLIVHDKIHGEVQWEDGSLAFDAACQDNCWSLDARLDHLNAQSVSGWIGEGWKGFWEGEIHGVFREGAWRQTAGRLLARQVSLANLLDGVEGTVAWEGDFAHWQDQLRLRMEIIEGDIFLPESPLHHVQGVLSLVEGAGAKWEWGCVCNQKALYGSGRGFLQSVQETWIESDLRCGDESFSLQGVEEGEMWRWSIACDAVSSDLALVLRGIAVGLGVPLADWSLLEGTISGKAHVVSKEREVFSWEIEDAHCSKLSVQRGAFVFGCALCDMHHGLYSFQGGRFSIPHFQGEEWNG